MSATLPADGDSLKGKRLSIYRETEQDEVYDFDSSENIDFSYSKFTSRPGLSILNPNSGTDGPVRAQQPGSAMFLEKIQSEMANVKVESFSMMTPDKLSNSSPPENSAFYSKPRSLPSSRHGSHEAKSRLPKLSSSKPDRRSNNRAPSVKLSLTPAQRVEKRPGMKASNALNDYMLFEKVGRGAFAQVYRGLNIKTNQVVAIKQISLDRDYDLTAFMGEIDLLKILKHPNIVKYHGFVKTSDSLNVLLEFCAGGSLRQIYKRRGRGFAESEITEYVVPILKGLHYLHEQGVVHRDVKAANVLITEANEVKLADFGIATTVATSHNTVVGTPNWMAPETILGGDGICTASDIWSLGATIIELFTTNPPYHDLNPMAALHAIGTNEHPPLPTGLSPVAKDFLLECFQKQANLRVGANLLLKHRWLSMHAAASFPSERNVDAVESIENAFGKKDSSKYIDSMKTSKVQSDTPITPMESSQTRKLQPRRPQSRLELLAQFTEDKDDEMPHFQDTINSISAKDLKRGLQLPHPESLAKEEEQDPFFELDVNSFDSKELDVQIKMETLSSKLASKVSNFDQSQVGPLIKITGSILHAMKKSTVAHDVFMKEHGILVLMELLENAQEFDAEQRLCQRILSIFNTIFESNVAQLDNFSLLGGIPMITDFSKPSFKLKARMEVARFVKCLRLSEKSLLVFVSSGGLRILSRFLEEDFEVTPEFPLVAVHCIHEILSKDITRFKSDMCRILSKYGIVFWFVTLLKHLTKCHKGKECSVPAAEVEESIDKILEVIRIFGLSESRVCMNIATPDLFKMIIKVYSSLSFSRQLVLLKFFRSMTGVSGLLKQLCAAEILEFYVRLLREYTPSAAHYKEVLNTVCPSLYNCCILNHNREFEIVKLGAVPLLRDLSKINLPFRQFVLPILCELVYCDSSVYSYLLKNNITSVYYNLLIDPYWHYNAMDSILHWSSQDASFRWLDSPVAQNCLVSGFMLSRVSNLEPSLENYLKLLNSNAKALSLMTRESVIESIMQKLAVYTKRAAAKLTLLRILHLIISKAAVNGPTLSNLTVVKDGMQSIVSDNSSVLAQELANKIISVSS